MVGNRCAAPSAPRDTPAADDSMAVHLFVFTFPSTAPAQGKLPSPCYLAAHVPYGTESGCWRWPEIV